MSTEIEPITLTVPTAAKVSGLGQSTIWAKIASGELESTSVGRRRLVIFASLKRLLQPKEAA